MSKKMITQALTAVAIHELDCARKKAKRSKITLGDGFAEK